MGFGVILYICAVFFERKYRVSGETFVVSVKSNQK